MTYFPVLSSANNSSYTLTISYIIQYFHEVIEVGILRILFVLDSKLDCLFEYLKCIYIFTFTTLTPVAADTKNKGKLAFWEKL